MQKDPAQMAGVILIKPWFAARWFAVVWLGLGVITAQAATVTASLDRPVATLGETITLSLTINGAQVGQPTLPALQNFQLVGTGSSYSIDATRGLAQQVFTYQLQPTTAGDLLIPAFQIRAGNETLVTRPLTVKVVPPGASVGAPGANMPSAFVKLVLPKAQFHVGEVVEAEIQVYFQQGRMTQYPNVPADPGLSVGKWPKHTETRVTVSNQFYNLVIFKLPFTPVKAGLVNLGPATASLLVPDPTRRPDIFFGRPEREVRMATERATLQVLPVPVQNAPASFAGAVGSFTLSVSAAPTNLAAGDPITLRAQIRGRGALDSVQLPPQAGWTDFKTYPPNAQIEGGDQNNFSGTKTFEQVVVPERAGITTLPPLAFSYFDPDAKAFRTVTGPAFALNVTAASGGSTALPNLPGVTNNNAGAQPASDLAHIRPHLGAPVVSPVLLAKPAFLAMQLLPPAVWLGLMLLRQRRERFANDPRLRRRLEVARIISDGLKELRKQMEAQDSEAFFATFLRLLQEQIGERVGLPASAITEAVVEEKLRPAGAPVELCETTRELFQACNLARYAPVKSSQELASALSKLELVLYGFQQWEPGKR